MTVGSLMNWLPINYFGFCYDLVAIIIIAIPNTILFVIAYVLVCLKLHSIFFSINDSLYLYSVYFPHILNVRDIKYLIGTTGESHCNGCRKVFYK